ncbi:MAG: methyltransferase domain-containing protein [Candidatus Paceibacterota bacterium]
MTPLDTAGFAHPPRNVDALSIEPGMTVVDFGSGSGAYVLAIAERLKNKGHVYAIDVQQDLLRRTKNETHKKGYTNVEVIWSDLEKPMSSKIADRHVDVVLVSNLLFQLEDKTAPLTEAWRILKPAGKLAVIDWSESFGGMGPVKNEVVNKELALALAKTAGFELVSEFNAGAHHYGLILRPVART